MRSRFRLVAGGCLVVLAIAFGGGCGRKAPPRAPELVIPRSPDPVAVESTADGVKITWHRPSSYVDGEPLGDLAGFRVRRACQPEIDFTEIQLVEVTDQQRFRKASSFTMLDHDAPLGVSCRYQVIAFTLDEYTSPPAESADVVRTVAGAKP